MKTFTYWDTLKYENKNNDHSILVESKMYCIKVNWFDSKSGGFIWSSKGSTDKLLLEVGEKGEKVIAYQTKYKGKEHNDPYAVIDSMNYYLKNDPDYKKFLRQVKLERIIK